MPKMSLAAERLHYIDYRLMVTFGVSAPIFGVSDPDFGVSENIFSWVREKVRSFAHLPKRRWDVRHPTKE